MVTAMARPFGNRSLRDFGWSRGASAEADPVDIEGCYPTVWSTDHGEDEVGDSIDVHYWGAPAPTETPTTETPTTETTPPTDPTTTDTGATDLTEGDNG